MRKIIELTVSKIALLVATILGKFGILLTKYFDVFGHQSWNLEYLARIYYKKCKRRPLIIAFQRSEYMPNRALYQHHKENRIVIVPSESIWSKIYRMCSSYEKDRSRSTDENSNLSRGGPFSQPTMDQLHCDEHAENSSYIAFPLSSEQKSDAQKVLALYGLRGQEYFCFLDRNLQYKQNIADAKGRNYLKGVRFDQERNTKLENYYLAAETAGKSGLVAVRLGKNTDRSAESDWVVDYAYERKKDEDFSDLALMNYCKFYLGPNSGLWLLARSFNRPVCLINVFPWPWINVPMKEDCLVMPKKIWCKDNKRVLTIKEMVEMEEKFYWKRLYSDKFFDDLSIEVIENTAEDIKGAATEMRERLDGTWSGKSYPLSELFTNNNVARQSRANISATFIENNKELLN